MIFLNLPLMLSWVDFLILLSTLERERTKGKLNLIKVLKYLVSVTPWSLVSLGQSIPLSRLTWHLIYFSWSHKFNLFFMGSVCSTADDGEQLRKEKEEEERRRQEELAKALAE